MSPLVERRVCEDQGSAGAADYTPTPAELDGLLGRALHSPLSGRAGKYRVYSAPGRLQTTLVVIETAAVTHKYVMAADRAGQRYLVVLPAGLAPSHGDIIRRLEKTLGSSVRCSGGGFVSVGSLVVLHGCSGEYGEAEHRVAREQLEEVLPSELPVIVC